MSSLPTPSSSWVVGLGGAVHEVKPDGKKVSARAGKPLFGRPRSSADHALRPTTFKLTLCIFTGDVCSDSRSYLVMIRNQSRRMRKQSKST